MSQASSRIRPPLAAAVILASIGFGTPSRADQEAANRTYVTTDPWGTCYARSAPAEVYGTAGRTDVFAVGTLDQPDWLVASYDVFSNQIYLSCLTMGEDGSPDIAMATLGPWPRGRQPDSTTLAIAFFFAGQEVARYSTSDISGGRLEAVSCSVSHYQVIAEIEGFQRDAEDRDVFVLVTVDGLRLTFDATTGELLDSVEGAVPQGGRGAC
jgi:hypothetical protein